MPIDPAGKDDAGNRRDCRRLCGAASRSIAATWVGRGPDDLTRRGVEREESTARGIRRRSLSGRRRRRGGSSGRFRNHIRERHIHTLAVDRPSPTARRRAPSLCRRASATGSRRRDRDRPRARRRTSDRQSARGGRSADRRGSATIRNRGRAPSPSGQFTRNASGRPHATLNASPDVTCRVHSSLPVLMSNAMNASDVLPAGSEYASPVVM